MFYKSTRNSSIRVESAAAIAKGISEEGGLFVPETIPSISMDELKSLAGMNYAERAAFVFSKYLTDYTELRYCTESAYTTKAFDTENIAEIAHLFEGTYMLELWHGPTCAFKDMALQILPYFLTTAVKKLHMDKKVVILVATSGDTGKAGGLQGRSGHRDHGLLSGRRCQRHAEAADGDTGRRKRYSLCRKGQLRRLPEWCQEDLHRPQGAGSTGTGRYDILQCELH